MLRLFSSRLTTPLLSRPLSSSPPLHPLTDFVLSRLQSEHAAFLEATFAEPPLISPSGTVTLASPSLTISTTYDSSTSRHLLLAAKGSEVGEYVLQDNKTPAWQAGMDRLNMEEKIHKAVDELVEAVSDTSAK
jgi:hypothetical protein